MSKAVLISIRPKWCEKIVNGEKTVEVRKTRPQMVPPFKCYIYCTLQGMNDFFRAELGGDVARWNRGKTNVVYTTLSEQMIFEQADIGKTVFLIREEAEKALEAMREEEAT